jgi:anti-anti-sigma regulatory factor
MSDFIFERAGGIGLLVFSGDLTARDAKKLQRSFMVSFESVDYLVVNLKNVSALDASCFGLFCTAHRIFARCNKRLLLVGLRTQDCGAGDPRSRPARFSQCDAKCGTGCLWNG